MPRVTRKSFLFFSLTIVRVAVTSFPIHAVLIDIQDALHSRYKENEDKGDLTAFPKGILNGDLYDHAQAMAELQLAAPALSALDLTYQSIADRCAGDLSASDVTNVFGRSVAGEKLK